MAEWAVHHMEIARPRPHRLERRLGAKAPERHVGRRAPHDRCGRQMPALHAAARRYLAALVVGLATTFPGSSMGHAPSLQECFEAGDFIANAARARENGVTKSVFIDRLVADVYAIQAFPPELRWFVVDPEDAEFLVSEASQVFDRPMPPEAHRANFLSRCFDH